MRFSRIAGFEIERKIKNAFTTKPSFTRIRIICISTNAVFIFCEYVNREYARTIEVSTMLRAILESEFFSDKMTDNFYCILDKRLTLLITA